MFVVSVGVGAKKVIFVVVVAPVVVAVVLVAVVVVVDVFDVVVDDFVVGGVAGPLQTVLKHPETPVTRQPVMQNEQPAVAQHCD